jgi:hypothetical protein
MEWTGRFTSNTNFRFYYSKDGEVMVDEELDPVSLFKTLEENRESLESFADDLIDITKPPTHPQDALRLADSIYGCIGL